MPERNSIGNVALIRLWLPLWATWLMMAIEGPFLAAMIARLPAEKFNLAAFGVAFAFAIIVEAPVIMMMSAANALVGDAASYRRLRNFTFALNGLLTLVLIAALVTPFFAWLTSTAMGLAPEVVTRTRTALFVLLPWPAAIGYRRFYQGILIRSGATRRVATGTGLRLTAMSATALLCYRFTDVEGATVGAAALTAAVCVEAVASRAMAASAVRRLIGVRSEEARTEEARNTEARGEEARATAKRGASFETGAPGYGEIWRFYYPLALTSTIALAAHPIVTFFLGQSRAALESLAVVPVINGLTFLFRTWGLSFQDVAIAVLGARPADRRMVARFALVLAAASSLGLAVIAATPLARLWLVVVSGLAPELAAFAHLPLRILIPLPALSVLLAWQRALLILARRTGPITTASIVEVAGIVVALLITVRLADLVGATAAAVAFLVGRLAGNASLLAPCRDVSASAGAEAPPSTALRRRRESSRR